MKRMVLIPEEKLLRYEERDKQRPENRDGMMYGGGEEEEPQEDSLSVVIYSRFGVAIRITAPLSEYYGVILNKTLKIDDAVTVSGLGLGPHPPSMT